MTDEPASAPTRTFFGQPVGVAYLAFTEAWERVSFYGRAALVVLYMVQQLLLPGHVEHVAGMAGFRHALEGVFGPLSHQALASQIYGFYSGFVYFTPIIGGFVADRWLGARRTVLLGAAIMSAGHFLMAFEQSFLLAILMLIVGTGCLKGNISAQVGRLHPPEDEAGRTRSYAVFSMGINPGDVAKIGIGAALAAASALLLSLGAAMAGAGHVSVLLPLVAFTGMGIAFLYYWPTLLALVSQSAPARLNATLMGTVFLSLVVSNLIIGWFGGYYEPLGPTDIWLVDAAIGGAGALIILVFGRFIHRALQPAMVDETAPSA